MRPRVFIASSVEGKRLAEAIQANLDHDAYCTVWSQRPFVTGTIDSLLESVRTNDFGVFVLSPDDVTVLRAEQYRVARDNVLLEAGMFLSRYGKDCARTTRRRRLAQPAPRSRRRSIGCRTMPRIWSLSRAWW
jgi:predicted nucleotide-binding protein